MLPGDLGHPKFFTYTKFFSWSKYFSWSKFISYPKFFSYPGPRCCRGTWGTRISSPTQIPKFFSWSKFFSHTNLSRSSVKAYLKMPVIRLES